MEWILQLHPPPYHPALDGMLVHQALPTSMLPLNTKFKTCVCVCVCMGVCVCVCVCVLEGGGGGERKTKQFLVKENLVMEQNQPPPHHPQSSVWCDDYPSTKI